MIAELLLLLSGNASGALIAMEAMKKGMGSVDETIEKHKKGWQAANKAITTALIGVGVAVGAVAAESVRLAAQFEQTTTSLVTGAGESAANLNMVRQGLLDLSTQVGVSANDLAQGMYMVESAGFHGADGLNVMKAAAEGAKVGAADMSVVANALTTVLTDYKKPASEATAVTSELVAAVGQGKMHMEDLAGRLSAVLPTAAAAGISFEQVAAGIATMTAHGVSADQAAQDLANTIRSLQNPSHEAQSEMEQLGLSVLDVEVNVGKKGLTGTLEELANAVTSKMGPRGTVILDTFKKSEAAGKDAQIMLAKMPPTVKAIAEQYLQGTKSQKDFRHEMLNMPVALRPMLTQFDSVVASTRGFNDLLKEGSPDAQTFAGAMSKLLGGATGLNTALQLTGPNMVTFQDNVRTIGDAAKNSGKNVKGWAEVQKDFNFQLDQAKASAEKVGITLGTTLLPALSTVFQAITPIITRVSDWMEAHKQLLPVIVGVVLALAGFAVIERIVIALKIYRDLVLVVRALTLRWAAAQWLLNTAMMANPYVLIALAVIALIAALVLLFTHIREVADFLGNVVHLLRDVFGRVVGFLRDVFGKVVGWFKDQFAKVADFFAGWGRDLQNFFGGILDKIKEPFAKIAGFFESWGGDLLNFFTGIWDQIKGVFNRFLGWIQDTFVKPFQKSFEELKTIVGNLWQAMWTIIHDVVEPVINVIVQVVKVGLNVIGAVFRVVFDRVSNTVRFAWNIIESVFRAAVAVIQVVVRIGLRILQAIWNVFGQYVMTVVKIAWDLITTIFRIAFSVISGVVSVGWAIISGIFSTVFNAIATVVKVVWDIISGIFKLALSILSGHWGEAWDGIKNTVMTVFNDIVGFFRGIFGTIGGIIGTALTAVSNTFTTIFGGIKTFVSGFITDIVNFFAGIPGDLANAFKDLGNFLATGFKNVVNTIIIDPINRALRWIGDLGGGIGPVSVHVRDAFGGHMPQIPRLHQGGVVPGLFGQEVPAILQAGELVISVSDIAAMKRGAVTSGLTALSTSLGGNGAGGNVQIYQDIHVSGLPEEVVTMVRGEIQRNNAQIVRQLRTR